MKKSHKDIDWEYESECLAQTFYLRKYNRMDYPTLKDVCEEEVIYYMENDDDTLSNVRKRVRERVKRNITWFRYEERKTFINHFKTF